MSKPMWRQQKDATLRTWQLWHQGEVIAKVVLARDGWAAFIRGYLIDGWYRSDATAMRVASGAAGFGECEVVE